MSDNGRIEALSGMFTINEGIDNFKLKLDSIISGSSTVNDLSIEELIDLKQALEEQKKLMNTMFELLLLIDEQSLGFIEEEE